MHQECMKKRFPVPKAPSPLILSTKKMHSLKVEYYVLFGKSEDLCLGCSLSDSSETLLPRGKGGDRIHRSFFNKDQVLDFLCTGRCKSLGSLKSFL